MLNQQNAQTKEFICNCIDIFVMWICNVRVHNQVNMLKKTNYVINLKWHGISLDKNHILIWSTMECNDRP